MRVSERIREQSAPEGGAAVWWLGQNSYVLRGPTACLMVDPFFTYPGSPDRYLCQEPPLRADELAPDAVFCTHDHMDHTDGEFLAALAAASPATRFWGPPESVARMRGAGVPADRAEALAAGERVRVGEVSVEVVLSKTPEVSDVAHFGYVFDFGGVRVYDTGDIMRGVTREAGLMAALRAAGPDVALITTSPTEEEFPDFGEAAQLALAIGARVAIPTHYHCFADRTFDPGEFVRRFPESPTTRPAVIEYCGCAVFGPGGTQVETGRA